MKPQQQSRFRRIAHRFRLSFSKFQESSGIDRNAFSDQGSPWLRIQLLRPQRIEIGLINLHLVLRQRTRLICANHRRSTHRLASMHLTHQIIGL